MPPPSDRDLPDFRAIAVVGVGLIGGSLAGAIRSRRISSKVIGVGRDRARLSVARDAGLVDDISTDLITAASRSDLLVFCTPVDRVVAGVREAAGASLPGTLITDAGSVKGSICRPLETGLPGGVEFIGSHPLAGSEKQGFEHADPQLFDRRVCVVTPVESSTRQGIDRLTRFWQRVGSTVMEMSPEAHDRALAQTSHLPHVVAAALAAVVDEANGRYAASGFRDTTRIAGGDADLWTAILLANSEPVLAALQSYDQSLGAFRQALETRDAVRLKSLLAAAKARRDGLIKGFSP